MFVKVTSGCLFAKLTSAWLPLQPEFNYSIDEENDSYFFSELRLFRLCHPGEVLEQPRRTSITVPAVQYLFFVIASQTLSCCETENASYVFHSLTCVLLDFRIGANGRFRHG